MQTQPARYRILSAVDGSDTANIVIEHALSSGSRRGGAELHVLRVLPLARRLAADDAHRRQQRTSALTAIEADLRALVADAVGAVEPADGLVIRLHAREGSPHEEILELADELRADLIVLGRHGEGRRPILGSVPERVVRDALCPVAVVQSPSYEIGEVEAGCPECAAVRAESRGEAWFCAAHRGDRRWRTNYLGPIASGSLRGPGIWT